MRLALLVVVVLTSPALADDREDARREFAAGQAADRAQHYQEAIEHYQRANDLVPHPNTSFNIAVDFEKLHKPREAVTWYRRYLAQISDEAERARTEKLVDDLRLRPGTVVVRSEPDGARVLVDGTPAGHTPLTTKLPGGLHRIVVEANGQSEERDISTEFGEPQDVAIRLRRPDGELIITGTPAGALVTVDDQPAGTLPTTVNVEAGTHRVHVTSYGLPPWDRTFVVEPNGQTTVDVQMTQGAATTTPGAEPPRVIKLGYLLGATGGADLRGSGAMALGEVGLVYSRVGIVVQIGKANGTTLVAILARWTILAGRLSPVLGLGVVTTSGSGSDQNSGGGLSAEAGLRLTIARGDAGSLSALLSSGAYYYRTSDATGATDLSVAVPLSLSLEGTFGD